jgi:hypothetical protein
MLFLDIPRGHLLITDEVYISSSLNLSGNFPVFQLNDMFFKRVVVVSIDDMEGIEKINQNISKTLKISLLL